MFVDLVKEKQTTVKNVHKQPLTNTRSCQCTIDMLEGEKEVLVWAHVYRKVKIVSIITVLPGDLGCLF